MDQQYDILNPRVSVRWEECKSKSVPEGMMDVQAFWLNDRYYLTLKEGLKEKVYVRNAAELYVYTPVLESWEKLSARAPVYNFAVTTYSSELVLVGGREATSGVSSDKLLVLKNEVWRDDLYRFMPAKRRSASAVSKGKHLVVAGGYGDDGPLSRVDVYDGESWRPAEPLPKPCFLMKSILHDGKWYLMGGKEQEKRVYCASLKALIATSESQASMSRQPSIWSQLYDAPFDHSCPAVFGNRLIITGPNNPALYAYSGETNTWKTVGEIPVGFGDNFTISLPSGELMVVGRNKGSSNYQSFIGFTDNSNDDELTKIKRENTQLRHAKEAAVEECSQLKKENRHLKTELAQLQPGASRLQTPQKLELNPTNVGFYLEQLSDEDLRTVGKALGLCEQTLTKMKNIREEVVVAWLLEKDDVMDTSGPPTWDSLYRAVNKSNNQ